MNPLKPFVTRKRQYIHFPVCLGQEKGLTSQQKTYSLDPVQNFVLLRIVNEHRGASLRKFAGASITGM